MKLKPCPFCGSDELKQSHCLGEYWILCKACDASCGMDNKSMKEAISLWNRRSPRPLSKRKLESYKRAECVAQEARFQAQSAQYENQAILADHVIYWMRSTGNVKYSRPNLPNV